MPTEDLRMKRVEVTTTVRATAHECFACVADHRKVKLYLTAFSEYRPLTRKTTGVGSRFLTVLDLGGQHLKGELETIEWVVDQRISAQSVSGPRTRASWVFEEYEDGTTDIRFTHEFDMPGVFRLVPSGPILAGVKRELSRSMERLKELVEVKNGGS
ncbi:MAG: SRPBCC family protein [Candidatus Dormibacteria bacterium]